ncbi:MULTISPECIES: hypothetical protein [Thermococcus]|uniref:Uncharacterized protein n=1 Tax=Thermococcus barophilus (strain DSM 11836 / MP) TaxID=391623 RepID=F0LM40_THEBM|nr:MULTISPECIES: hypothetical protein [Thermococcus]ADT83887.1 hypothetical protein TERMP_00911 [Thermococcus barophilus MP]WRS53065.1 hypothetical protein VFC49_02675 [Thermococcus sp. SY098]
MIIAKPCVTMKGVVVQLYSWDKEIKLDLDKVSECLKKKGIEIKKLIPNMLLIAVMNGFETSIYPGGKVIIKELTDTKKGEEIAKTVYDCVDG